MLTTLTVNGVDIETTASIDQILAALQPKAATTPQPKAEAVIPQPKAEAKPVAQPKAVKATKRTNQPKAASNGKALWAQITTLVAEGNYDEARSLASAKPDTFGVQCDAAIKRHEARTAKPSSETPKAKVTRLPEGKQTRKARQRNQPKAAVAKLVGHPVLDAVQPEPTKAEKRAAKQQAAKVAAKPRNHKPDCGCVTCPKGVEQRKANAQPKAETVTKAAPPKAAPKPKASTLPEIAEPIVATNPPKAVEAETVRTEGDAKITLLMEAMDVDGLAKASGAYLQQMKRQERLGRQELAMAYDHLVDTADTAITVIREQQAATA